VRIAVCLKQVPSRGVTLRLNSEGTWVQDVSLSYEINEPDIYALEEALRLKEGTTESQSEVIVCSLGPPRTQQAIKEALAKGADRALHLDDAGFEGLDAYGTARCLAAALRKERPDLVLTGLQSDDLGFAQTGVVLAEMMGLPHSTIIIEVQLSGRGVRVKRELEAGWFQWIEVPLPALLTIQSGISKPRYATLKGIMAAKNKPIQRLSISDLGLNERDIAPRQKITKIYLPAKRATTEFLGGSAREVAVQLIDRLKNEARVL
jgi:electron transfer flavoprotein beta subunit